jgi:hypothetical protein
MTDKLKVLGLKKQFFPYMEPETGAILLKTKKPAALIDGLLVGSEIDLYDNSTFRVWTPHKKKAMAYAKEYSLRIQPLDGEAELFVPVNLADELLPNFRAKVKGNRIVSPQAAEALRQYHASKRLAGPKP